MFPWSSGTLCDSISPLLKYLQPPLTMESRCFGDKGDVEDITEGMITLCCTSRIRTNTSAISVDQSRGNIETLKC